MNLIANVVTFYDGNDICRSDNCSFAQGTYLYNNVMRIFAQNQKFRKPKIVKIEAYTSLSVYYGPSTQEGTRLCSIKDDVIIYNNPYKDRFVVVKLPDKTITRFDVNPYTPSIERMDVGCDGIFFSTTDILIILLLVLMLWLYRFE